MLSQAAICLAKDVNKAELKGGFWTPSTAFGDKLINRLSQFCRTDFRNSRLKINQPKPEDQADKIDLYQQPA